MMLCNTAVVVLLGFRASCVAVPVPRLATRPHGLWELGSE